MKNRKRKHSSNGVSENRNSQGSETGKKICQYHGMCGHTTNECTLVKALVQKEKIKKLKASYKWKCTKQEVNILVEKKMKQVMKKRKKQHKEELCAFKNMSVSDS